MTSSAVALFGRLEITRGDLETARFPFVTAAEMVTGFAVLPLVQISEFRRNGDGQAPLALYRAAEAFVRDFFGKGYECFLRNNRIGRLMDRWQSTDDPAVRQPLLEGVGTGINEWQLKNDDPRDALETYLHEYRSAEQNYEVLKSHGVGWPSVDPDRPKRSNTTSTTRASLVPKRTRVRIGGPLAEVDAERFATHTADEIAERRDEVRGVGSERAGLTTDSDGISARRLAAERRAGR